MNEEIRALKPERVWNYFAELNAVPRGSKKEEKVIEFMRQFGEKLSLETMVDQTGNVIIRKPATPGMEDRTPVILQSHLDMVHQKNADTDFDFDTQGIDMYVDDGWVKARGTTLGADNGLGVASIMAILDAEDIPHPPLEALFTIDEETGMTGARGLEGGILQGKVLLNLDTEEDNELTIGCAGGLNTGIEGSFTEEPTPEGMQTFKISIRGLSGGHSGTDIHLGRGNANKLMNRLFWKTNENFGLRINEIDGGGLRNAIPRESFAWVSIPKEKIDDFSAYVAQTTVEFKAEYDTTDPNLEIAIEQVESRSRALPVAYQENLIAAIYACPNGIYRMSPDIEGLVQTSNNLARVVAKDGKFSALTLQRSAVESEKQDIANAIRSAFSLLDATVEHTGGYPGWAPKPTSDIVRLMGTVYKELFETEADIMACHAGLECGILGSNYPQVDMISFGPTIRGAHSPDERANIDSFTKFWTLLLETLKRLP